MRVSEFEQRTEGWFAERLGKPTASSFHRLITPTGKKCSSADNYINELVAERITGKQTSTFTSEAMQRGADMEPEARSTYELITSKKVSDIGLCLHDILDCGASPDGLIDDGKGVLEIKCPMQHTMVGYLRAGDVLPGKFIPQVQGQLWITGLEYCDFLAYHPEMKVLLAQIQRDEEYIEKLAIEVGIACLLINEKAQEFLAQ